MGDPNFSFLSDICMVKWSIVCKYRHQSNKAFSANFTSRKYHPLSGEYDGEYELGVCSSPYLHKTMESLSEKIC